MNTPSRYLIICSTLLLSGCYRPGSFRTYKEKKELGKQLKLKRPTVQIKEMTHEQALEAVSYYEELGNSGLLVALYQRITATGKDPDIISRYMVKLADFYLGEGNFNEAIKQYRRAITLYPGAQGIERARYREIVAYFWNSLQPQRDQATTRMVIKLGKEYLANPADETSQQQIQGMVAASYKKLLENELLVAKFYYNKYLIGGVKSALPSAAQRISHITEQLLPDMATFLPESGALYEQLLPTAQEWHRIQETEDVEHNEELQTAVAKEVVAALHHIESYLNKDSAHLPDFSKSRDKF